MSERSTLHATFAIERTYDASPQRVFAAWADPVAKAHWFGPPGQEREMDFRVGGRERFRATAPDGAVYVYDATFQDIVPDQRIVYSYDMHRNEDRISVSVATVEFRAAGERTELTFTEQGAYLDGHDTPAEREHGTGELLSKLTDALASDGGSR